MLLGCRPKSQPPDVTPQADRCRLGGGGDSVKPADTLVVALADSVRLAHASNPTNDSERLLFRKAFETLIRLDCQGQTRPGLAVAWSPDTTGRVWTFTLRDESRLSGDPPRTARIVSEWQTRPAVTQAVGIESVRALDHRRLAVTLREPEVSVPRLFADPALSVTHTETPLGSVTRLVTPRSDDLPVVDFRVTSGSDPRDALDRGADLIVTRDPALVEYAENRPELVNYPLPWSRTYLLLQPPGAEPIERTITSDSVRRSLARDAVRAEARVAELPFWWDSLTSCPPAVPASGTRVSSRIVYPRGDEVARGLAERIVALTKGGTQSRVAGLGDPELAAALRSGTERAYVVSVPRQSLAPCRDSAEWPADVSITPLIDTRARAILRRGSAALTVDWDGTVRVAPPSPGKDAS